MKTVTYNGKVITAYQIPDLQSLKPIVEKAKELWRIRCRETMNRLGGDKGSCVIGAGFAVLVIEPRCRKPRLYKILTPNDVCSAQGSIIWEESKDEIEKLFLENGVPVHYCYGFMD